MLIVEWTDCIKFVCRFFRNLFLDFGGGRGNDCNNVKNRRPYRE